MNKQEWQAETKAEALKAWESLYNALPGAVCGQVEQKHTVDALRALRGDFCTQYALSKAYADGVDSSWAFDL